MKYFNIVLIFITSLFLGSAASAIGLAKPSYSRGTLSLGGVATLPVEWDTNRGASWSANLEPQFGLFVQDRLQLVFNAKIKTPLVNEHWSYGGLHSSWRWGLGFGVRYMFDLEWIATPYVGIGLNYEMSELLIYSGRAYLDAPLGLLVPLSKNVALNLGVNVRAFFVINAKVFDRISLEPGFLGVAIFL